MIGIEISNNRDFLMEPINLTLFKFKKRSKK